MPFLGFSLGRLDFGIVTKSSTSFRSRRARVAAGLRRPCAKPAPAQGKSGDGDEEVARLRRVGAIANRFGRAFGREEARIAVLPSGKLAFEKIAARRGIAEQREVPIQAGEKACGTTLPHVTGHAEIDYIL